MKTTLADLVLLSMGTIPDSLFAKDKTVPDDLQPPAVNIKPSIEQLPEIVLAVKPVVPRGPKELIEGYEGEMEAVTGRFASELASISHAAEQNQVSSQQAEQISNTSLAIRERLDRGGKLIIFGNGGSATDANDWALDCIIPPNSYQPIPAVSLSLEPANVTAIANDVVIELIFLRQLIAQARPEDVAIGISTSGGSKNVVAALEEARKRGLLTAALLGYDGGEIVRRNLVDFPIVVNCDYIPRIQEVQASIYHVIREALEILGRG